MQIRKTMLTLIIISALAVPSVSSYAQNPQPQSPYKGNSGTTATSPNIEEIKQRYIKKYLPTDSTEARKNEDVRNMQSLSGAIQADTVGIYGYEDANDFIQNQANRCTADTELPVCFTRVSVSRIGATRVDGGGSCPEDYETLMNYGTGVVLEGTNQMLYYYQDHRVPYTSNAQWNWYWAQGGYRLETCPTWERWTLVWDQDNIPRGQPENSPPIGICTQCDEEIQIYPGPLKKAGWVEDFTWTKRCYTRPKVPASCGTSVLGNRAVFEYTVKMLCRDIVRNAGYYKPPTATTYPVGVQVGGISPTIKICGRKINVWRPHEN